MNKMFFKKSADSFYETLLLGNGRLGATVYGGVNEDVYSLNDDTLWSGYPRDCIYDGTDTVGKPRKYVFRDDEVCISGYVENTEPLDGEIKKDCVGTRSEIFERVKKYVFDGNLQKAQLLLEQLYGTYSQSYQPAGSLRIKADFGEYSDYKRELSLSDAVHTTEFSTANGKYTRCAFVSYPDDVMAVRYRTDAMLPDMTVSLDSQLRFNTYFENGTLILEGEAHSDAIPSYIMIPEQPTYNENPAERGMRYAVALRVKTDGEVAFENGSLRIRGARELEVYLTARTSFAGYNRHPFLDGIDYKASALAILDAALAYSYGELYERHTKDFGALFNRVKFELDGGREDLPTDERLKAHAKTPDPGIYALMYQLGRYFMISSSRPGTQATNLQGIWNEEVYPPWSANYTTNINVQMNYWGACGANLAECCEPLHQLIYEVAECGKRTAKVLHGAEGFCAHHNTDLWRMTYPVGGWSNDTTQYAYFPLGGAWMASHLYKYYLATKDAEFLGGKAFDVIVECARFCDSMLTDYNGELLFTPGVSAENGYVKDGKKCALAKSSAMFQSIVREAFEACIASCDALGRNPDYARYLEKRLERVQDLKIGNDGRILEWNEEVEEFDVHHRHLSHLYAFYPAKQVKDEKLWEACRKSLEARDDGGMPWSLVWKMCLWSQMGESERVLSIADRLLTYVDPNGDNGGLLSYEGVPEFGVYPNLMCSYPCFNIDGNYGFVAAVQEMLAQEDGEGVKLLPALPRLWKNGKIEGIRVGGKTVSIEWRDGKLVSSSVI